MSDHIHASVGEDGYYTDRRGCYTGDSAFADARRWLAGEAFHEWNVGTADQIGAHDKITRISPDDMGEGIDVFVTRENGTEMSYRLMPIDGDCEETI